MYMIHLSRQKTSTIHLKFNNDVCFFFVSVYPIITRNNAPAFNFSILFDEKVDLVVALRRLKFKIQSSFQNTGKKN